VEQLAVKESQAKDRADAARSMVEELREVRVGVRVGVRVEVGSARRGCYNHNTGILTLTITLTFGSKELLKV